MASRRLVSRRDFLHGATRAGAAGIALHYVVPSGVLGAPGQPAPSDRVGVGVIGPGRQGSGLTRQAARKARIVATADVNLPRAEKVAQATSAKAFQDYRRLLDLEEVDAVIVATPDHWHAICSIHACQAGKDVYVEKPMTLTVREGRRMVEAARKHDRVVQCGSHQRSMARCRKGCLLVRNGRIGAISKVITHNYASPWNCALPAQPVPKGLDWDMWCGPTPLRPYHADIYKPRARPGWISFRPWSGGEMTGWGSHGLDQIQWALGMDTNGPVEIWTEGDRLVPPTYTKPESRSRGEKACNKPKVLMKYPGNILVEFADGPPGGGTFVGEKGTITIDRGRTLSDPPELATEPLRDPKVSLYVSKNHMANWLQCVKSRKRPVADVEIGHRSATVCHLANIARCLGRKLRWDSAKEQFIGDDEANTHLDRPRREPYSLPK